MNLIEKIEYYLNESDKSLADEWNAIHSKMKTLKVEILKFQKSEDEFQFVLKAPKPMFLDIFRALKSIDYAESPNLKISLEKSGAIKGSALLTNKVTGNKVVIKDEVKSTGQTFYYIKLRA